MQGKYLLFLFFFFAGLSECDRIYVYHVMDTYDSQPIFGSQEHKCIEKVCSFFCFIATKRLKFQCYFFVFVADDQVTTQIRKETEEMFC